MCALFSDDEDVQSEEEEESEEEQEDSDEEEKKVEPVAENVSGYDALHQLNANLAQLTSSEVIPVLEID